MTGFKCDRCKDTYPRGYVFYVNERGEVLCARCSGSSAPLPEWVIESIQKQEERYGKRRKR